MHSSSRHRHPAIRAGEFGGFARRRLTSYSSVKDLRLALARAATAHGEHEKLTGQYDENWPARYAAYMVAERSGGELPR
jgi:hypothetical protein